MSMHNQNMQNITFANTEPRGDIPTYEMAIKLWETKTQN